MSDVAWVGSWDEIERELEGQLSARARGSEPAQIPTNANVAKTINRVRSWLGNGSLDALAKKVQAKAAQAELNVIMTAVDGQLAGLWASTTQQLLADEAWLAALNNVTIPGVVDYFNARVAALQNLINLLTNTAAGNVTAALAALSARIGAVQSYAVGYSQALYNRSTAHENALAATLTRWIGDAGRQAQADAAAAQKAAEGHANALAAILTRWIGDAGRQAQAGDVTVGNRAAANLATTKTVLEGKIANGVSTAEGFATGAVTAAAPGIIAKAVTAVEAKIAPIATEVDKCLTPLCDTVTPNASQLGNLGKLLKGFESAGVAALLAVLVAEAVTDPKAAAGQIVDAGSWLTGEATDVLAGVGL
jgi:hypothetical protein